MTIRTAVILAGGRGTRMGPHYSSLPKPLLPVLSKPVLQHQIEWLAAEGVSQVILLAGHMSEKLIDFAKSQIVSDIKIDVVTESQPLGTAGALAQLKGKLKEPFLCLYGDLIINMDLKRLMRFHQNKDAELTLVVHPNDHPDDSDLVETDSSSRVTRILAKPHSSSLVFRNLVNAAVYLMTPEVLNRIPSEKADLAQDIFPHLVSRCRIFAYSTPEYMKDMGTPERLAQVEDALRRGQVLARHLANPRPVVFLDRDGVICRHVDQLSRREDFILLEGVSEALRKLNKNGLLSVVVTNQPMVAKGFLSFDQLAEIHKWMETLLGREGAWLDRIFYCPHHPEKGHPGEIEALKIACDCRKPGIGLLEQASKDFLIDMSRSWMVGDSWRDTEAGKRFGVKTIGIQNSGDTLFRPESHPDYVVSSLVEAVDLILQSGEQPSMKNEVQ